MVSEPGNQKSREHISREPSTRGSAFLVSDVLELKSFQRLDLEEQFRFLAERLCGDLKAIGISMKPYTSRGLVRFRARPREEQMEIVERLKANYLALEWTDLTPAGEPGFH